MRAPFSWYGAKYTFADWILGFIPQKPNMYCEVFGGAGGVLIRKRAHGVEVFNDLDSRIVNFFNVLRDNHEQLMHKLEHTPYSREHWNTLKDVYQAKGVDGAYAFFVRIEQSFSAKGSTWGCRYGDISSGCRAITFSKRVDNLRLVVKRLKEVQFENTCAIKLIWRLAEYGSNVIIYADPPYLLRTRKAGKQYKFEMSDCEHDNFLSAVASSPCAVVVSGYESDRYREALADWDVHKKEIACPANNQGGAGHTRREEILWVNPVCRDLLHAEKKQLVLGL